ncbi:MULTISPECIES: methylated-DNA--[protein]-cysteine S-methyltransferase [unclassified Anaeromyxobacter]|uniref:methylated-DNA--[protein]-cysteine S-methyltransferase n=1 Tax=unclassified Anaeromyxobacter TaxID=2620896 RepID=UPI001F5AF853|nr:MULTISPECIES: methylated-DNA--[protein]-cysteine S-methyltransferase [unclassified Anaeromyxobacter]
MTLRERVMESPVGRLRLLADGDALVAVYMEDQGGAPVLAAEDVRGDALLERACRQLEGWFAGERTTFDLPLRPRGTPFQLEVWRALAEIPFGETRTYGEIAARLGAPSAARAVGAANGRNPLAIVIPCHRVIGAGGALTGYAGGVERKRWLLEHERAARPSSCSGQ